MYYVGKIYNWQINQSVNGMELLPHDLLWERPWDGVMTSL